MSKIAVFGIEIRTNSILPKNTIVITDSENVLGMLRENSPGIWQFVPLKDGAKQHDGSIWMMHPSMRANIEILADPNAEG
jgi:hypothetical protein